jgi:hypothetical protein
MDTDNAVSFLIKDLSSVTTEIREQEVDSQDEALIIFDLIDIVEENPSPLVKQL